MSFKQLKIAVQERARLGWTATPIAFENLSFTPPDGPWIRLTLVFGEGRTKGLDGSTGYAEDRGFIVGQVFVPEGAATGAADGFADDFVALYQHTRFSGIVAYTASVRSLGINGGWHQTNISIPFRRTRNV